MTQNLGDQLKEMQLMGDSNKKEQASSSKEISLFVAHIMNIYITADELKYAVNKMMKLIEEEPFIPLDLLTSFLDDIHKGIQFFNQKGKSECESVFIEFEFRMKQFLNKMKEKSFPPPNVNSKVPISTNEAKKDSDSKKTLSKEDWVELLTHLGVAYKLSHDIPQVNESIEKTLLLLIQHVGMSFYESRK